MNRNIIVSVLSGFCGSALLLILLSAAGIVGARTADVGRSDVARTNEVSAATPLTSTFMYQGQLKNGSNAVNGSCQMAFRLYDDPLAGNLIGNPITPTVPVTNGLFTVGLNFGNNGNVFDGNGRWLDIQVKCGIGGFVVLTPRQALTPAPYALHAVDAWSINGDTGTDSNVNFLGTTDSMSLTFRVSNTVALRIVPASSLSYGTTPNIIGGYSGNSVTSGVVGATIGGGGSSGNENRVVNHYATIGGGERNTAGWRDTIGGGASNTASDFATTIGGGYGNTVSYTIATVGGGMGNTASDYAATVGGVYWNTASNYSAVVSGGANNIASGDRASVSGGYTNTASGKYATVPGGDQNSATMTSTLAAGHRAQANHQGAFVWADSTDADFASTANDQFIIRANGGVGINTNAPAAGTLDVNGDVIVRGADFIVKGRGGGQGNSGGAARALVDAGWGGSAVAGGGLYINFANDYGKVTVGSDLAVEGNVIIPTLGAAGATSLCLNGSQQIATCSSSLRYKNNVASLTLGLDVVTKLRPVTFNWKDSGQADLGFVAEEVNQVTPLLTTLNKDGQIEGVKYDRISAVLVKAVQEQQHQIAALKTQNADLATRLSRMEQNTTVNNPTSQAEPFNVSTPLNAIALIAVGWMWLQQRRSTPGGRA